MGPTSITTKPISLKTRPYQVAHLCFEIDGILESADAELGSTIKAFDFAAFYATLGAIPSQPGDPSRLKFDFLEIEAAIKPFMLASVRKEARKASLNQAVNMRQNAFISKYGNGPAIVALANQFYAIGVPGSKPGRLANLAAIAENQANELKAAYVAQGQTGVVLNSLSLLESTTDTTGFTDSEGRRDVQGISQRIGPAVLNAPPEGATGGSFATDGPSQQNFEEDSTGDHSSSSGSASQRQSIRSTDFAYRIPFLESQAQNERAQISLMDQRFAQFMSSLSVPFLNQVFFNELNSIDGDVFKLQVALLNGYLMSPIDGIVTGKYKYPGDAIRAGETMYRVEDNSTMFVEANVVHRGPVAIGAAVTITTSLFDASGPVTPITGSVVAARGHAVDNRWDLVIKCANDDGAGNTIIPLGYHFDYDDTTVSIA